MNDPRLQDHEMGLELQIIELVEQRERATLQHDEQSASRLQTQIDTLQAELWHTAEEIVGEMPA